MQYFIKHSIKKHFHNVTVSWYILKKSTQHLSVSDTSVIKPLDMNRVPKYDFVRAKQHTMTRNDGGCSVSISDSKFTLESSWK